MDPIEKRELKRRAWAKLAAQKRRAGLLRGRVVIASLICFALLWGIVFAQMLTGNDPVLSAKSKTVATRPIKRATKELKTTDVEGEAEGAAPTGEAEAANAAEAEAAEIEAAEIAEIEAAEAEALVTSQS